MPTHVTTSIVTILDSFSDADGYTVVVNLKDVKEKLEKEKIKANMNVILNVQYVPKQTETSNIIPDKK